MMKTRLWQLGKATSGKKKDSQTGNNSGGTKKTVRFDERVVRSESAAYLLQGGGIGKRRRGYFCRGLPLW